MKKTLFLFSLLLLFTHYVSAQETFKTQVTIKGISNLRGTIHALVTNDSSQFPSIDLPIATKKVAVNSSSITFEFEKLIGETKYSIVIFQDLNANEKMDMNWGRPEEHFGFSNYLMMGPPSWNTALSILKKITINLYAFK